MMSYFHTSTILKPMNIIRFGMFLSFQAQLRHNLFRHNIGAASTINNHRTHLAMGSASIVEQCFLLPWFIFLEVHMQTLLNHQQLALTKLNVFSNLIFFLLVVFRLLLNRVYFDQLVTNIHDGRVIQAIGLHVSNTLTLETPSFCNIS